MTKVMMIARGGRLEPAEDDAAEILRKVADGTTLVVDLHQPQDAAWLRKWWKLMTIVAENMPTIADKRGVSDMVLIAVGAADVRVFPRSGAVTPVPHSLADMDQDVRDRVWKRAVYYITTEWLPMAGDELEAEIDRFFHNDRELSLGRRVTKRRAA